MKLRRTMKFWNMLIHEGISFKSFLAVFLFRGTWYIPINSGINFVSESIQKHQKRRA
jgi:hypothetical protein